MTNMELDHIRKNVGNLTPEEQSRLLAELDETSGILRGSLEVTDEMLKFIRENGLEEKWMETPNAELSRRGTANTDNETTLKPRSA